MKESAILLATSIAGSQSALARSLKLSPQAVQKWCSTGVVPVERCFAIERLTRGQVTRKDLRPNDWQSIWPELAKKSKRAA